MIGRRWRLRACALAGVSVAAVVCGPAAIASSGRAASASTPFEVSASASGTDANAHSSAPSVDADGGVIAFESDATNLLPAGQDTNNARDIFTKSVSTGVVTRVSVGSSGLQSNGSAYAPSIDGRGDVVAYDSVARNLDSNLTNRCTTGLGDCNGKQDVFVHNSTTGANVLISTAYGGTHSGDGTGTAPVISADGSTVVYQSNDDNLTCAVAPCTGEAATHWNIYSYKIATGVTTLLTPDANGDSKFPWPNADGSAVAFYSTATNLVSGAATTGTQVFEYTASGVILVSQAGGVAGRGTSQLPMMSADGSVIVYDSTASNITASTHGQAVAYSTATGRNTVISACQSSCANGGTAGVPGNHPSFVVYSDATDARIAFVSNATNISTAAPSDGLKSLFVWSPSTGPVWENVGAFYTGGPAIGDDGKTVAWTQSLTDGRNQPSARVYALTLP